MENYKPAKLLLSCPAIHDPTFTYFSSAYMTLLSIIQAFVIAWCLSNLLDIFQNTSIDFSYKILWTTCIIPILLFAITLWHKYVNHHQIAGWQLSWKDTVLVVLFGIFQCLPVALLLGTDTDKHSLRIEHAFSYDWLILLIISIEVLFGTLAYAHSGSKLNQDYVKNILNYRFATICAKNPKNKPPCMEHLDEYADGNRECPAKKIHALVVGFEVVSFQSTLATSLILISISISYRYTLSAIQDLGLEIISIKIAILSFFNILFSAVLFRYLIKYDLDRLLENEDGNLLECGSKAQKQISNTNILWWYKYCLGDLHNKKYSHLVNLFQAHLSLRAIKRSIKFW